MRACALFAYRLDSAPFEPWTEADGHLVSRVAVEPLGVERVGDLLARHAAPPSVERPVGFRRGLVGDGRPVFFRRPSLFGIIYLVVGVALASSKNYFDSLDSIRELASAVLAIVLWPLLLLGIDLHIRP